MTVALSGTVTAAGVPVSGATVGAYGATGLLVGSAASTDGAGAYSLSLAAGVYKLLVTKAGYPSLWFGGASSFAGASDIILAAAVTADVALMVAGAPGHTLGTVDLWWDSFSGFSVPKFVQSIPLLSDGVSTDNEALQSGSMPRKRASYSLPSVTDADYLTLRGYFEAVTQVSCVTPLETFTVIVDGFEPRAVVSDVWSVSLSLVVVPA